jgi:hypothetical protein
MRIILLWFHRLTTYAVPSITQLHTNLWLHICQVAYKSFERRRAAQMEKARAAAVPPGKFPINGV